VSEDSPFFVFIETISLGRRTQIQSRAMLGSTARHLQSCCLSFVPFRPNMCVTTLRRSLAIADLEKGATMTHTTRWSALVYIGVACFTAYGQTPIADQSGTPKTASEQVDGFYYKAMKPKDKPPLGDYVLLYPDGKFHFVESSRKSSQHFGGTYSVEGDRITFKGSPILAVGATAADVPPAKHLLPFTNRIVLGVITEPDGTAWERPAKATDSASDRASSSREPSKASATETAGSKMTNDDVIQLVTGGLSDDVIGTSIRRASATAFDLTPTGLIALKKARVSDTLILFMQNWSPPASAQTSSSAAPSAPATAPPPSDPCTAIELMGLFKTDMRPMSPLIIYLAKIRNGTSLTRIVTVEWLDMYGQAMQSTNQVGAGQIVTTQLGANSPSDRQPQDLRITSCR
jgi:hypothetical protein